MGAHRAAASPNETVNADPARAQKNLADSKLATLLSLPTTNSAAGANVYIDLQYRPFVHSLDPKGDYIAIPPAIVAKSNLAIAGSTLAGSTLEGLASLTI